MPSVMVRWKGSCAYSTRRNALSARLRLLALEVHRKGECDTPVRYWKRIVSGKILVEGELLGREPVPESPFTFRVGGPVKAPPKSAPPELVAIPYVRLEGVEFRLPGNFYRDEDRISFMFASYEGAVNLPWVLTQAEDHAQCQLYPGEEVRAATLLLTRPGLRMRYSGEDWVQELLGWIRHYYLPCLDYWTRGGHLAGYETFQMLDPGNTRERDLIWNAIRR